MWETLIVMTAGAIVGGAVGWFVDQTIRVDQFLATLIAGLASGAVSAYFATLVVRVIFRHTKITTEEENPQSSETEDSLSQNKSVQGHLALTQVPVYFLAAILFAHLADVSADVGGSSSSAWVYAVLAGVSIVIAFLICVVTYTTKPERLNNTIVRLTQLAYGTVAAILFTVAWVGNMAFLIYDDTGSVLIYFIMGAGLLLVLLVAGYPVYERRKQNREYHAGAPAE